MPHDELHDDQLLEIVGMLHDDHELDNVGISISCVVVHELVQLLAGAQLLDQLLHEPHEVQLVGIQLPPSISVIFGEAHDGQLIDPHDPHELVQLDGHDPHDDVQFVISISLTVLQFDVVGIQLLPHEAHDDGIHPELPSMSVIFGEAHDGQLIDPHDPHELGTQLLDQLDQLLAQLDQELELVAQELDQAEDDDAHDEFDSISG